MRPIYIICIYPLVSLPLTTYTLIHFRRHHILVDVAPGLAGFGPDVFPYIHAFGSSPLHHVPNTLHHRPFTHLHTFIHALLSPLECITPKWVAVAMNPSSEHLNRPRTSFIALLASCVRLRTRSVSRLRARPRPRGVLVLPLIESRRRSIRSPAEVEFRRPQRRDSKVIVSSPLPRSPLSHSIHLTPFPCHLGRLLLYHPSSFFQLSLASPGAT